MEKKTFAQLRFNHILTKEEVEDKYNELLAYHRQVVKELDAKTAGTKKSQAKISSLQRSVRMTKAGRDKYRNKYHTAMRTARALREKLAEETTRIQPRKGPGKKWNTILELCRVYSTIEAKRRTIRLNRNEFLIMAILYGYKKLRLSDIYSKHPDLVKANFDIGKSIVPLVERGLVIRHKYGHKDRTLALSMLGIGQIEKVLLIR